MGELFFISEDPTTRTSAYATRINQQEWQKHKSEIRRLHDNGATRREIIQAISSNDFRPSFGQLVAQMTRWRLMRYSKLDQYGRPQSGSLKTQGTARGILHMVATLVGQAESATVNAASISRVSSNTSDSISGLLRNLSLQEQRQSTVECMPGEVPGPHHQEIRNDLGFAEFCFLGGSYDKAYQTYSKIVTSLIYAPVQNRDEIALVQAISGCLRSATTTAEWRQAYKFAMHYTNTDGTGNQSLRNTEVATEANEQQFPRTYAELARTTLDILNHLERTFSPLNTSNPALVNKVISRHWLALRLNRLPTWQAVLADTKRTPIPQVENLVPALRWAQSAITHFGLLFDEQINKLWQTARTSLETWTHLLFWRLLFANRQPDQPACPVLRIRLNDVSVCELSPQETLATVARLITAHLDGIPPPIQAHRTVFHTVRQVRHQCDGTRIMPTLWTVLHDTLHPALLSDESHSI